MDKKKFNGWEDRRQYREIKELRKVTVWELEPLNLSI